MTSRRPCVSRTAFWRCAAASSRWPVGRSRCTPSWKMAPTLEGESQIEHAHGIKRIWITPDDIRPSAEALTAIGAADVVVIGPGSLYTSLLPPLLVPGMREALADTRAARVFVCNVATQLGETEGYGSLASPRRARGARTVRDWSTRSSSTPTPTRDSCPAIRPSPVADRRRAAALPPAADRVARRGRRRQRPSPRLTQADGRDPRAGRRANDNAPRARSSPLTTTTTTDLVAALARRARGNRAGAPV